MKLKTASRRKAISPLIATLILIAITIVGGVVVYQAFFSTSNTVSTNVHATIIQVTVSGSGGVAATIKNDGNHAWDLTAITLLNATLTNCGTQPVAGTDWFSPHLSDPLSKGIIPGNSIAQTETVGLCAEAPIPGHTYTLQVTVTDTTGSSYVGTSTVVATT